MLHPLHPDRLFPTDTAVRSTAQEIYSTISTAPIISPHGHTDPSWFATDQNFVDPVSLLITPDHYIVRLFISQGFSPEELGVLPLHKSRQLSEQELRKTWTLFCENLHLFAGTPSALWLSHVFYEIFQLEYEVNAKTADQAFSDIVSLLKKPEYKPRALFQRFNFELLATTDAATNELADHKIIHQEFNKKIIPTFRPDQVCDPEKAGFIKALEQLSELTKESISNFSGYLRALQNRREFFKRHGATATDHGFPSALTANLSAQECEVLFQKIIAKDHTQGDCELFRAQMLTEFAKMSCDDGLVMQLHPGSFRNHSAHLFNQYGADKGGDIPTTSEYTKNLKSLLDVAGHNSKFKMILFTLDETTYSRELAPLAGVYPSLLIGPSWWFHDSPQGMLRHLESCVETAGFYNLAGFNDDTRAFFSIPARHDMARRMYSRFLAKLVHEHRIAKNSAIELAQLLTTGLVRKAYRL
jgi:glucuronate isomerase